MSDIKFVYIITANVLTKSGKWSGSRQIPTFIIDPGIQGVFSAFQAETLAKQIIDPMCMLDLDIHAEYVGIQT